MVQKPTKVYQDPWPVVKMSSEASTHLIPIWNAAAFQEGHLALFLGSAAQVQQPHTDLPRACHTDLTGIAPPQKSPDPALIPQTSFLGTTSPSPQAFSPKVASAQYLKSNREL